jgi:hypothetical protein
MKKIGRKKVHAKLKEAQAGCCMPDMWGYWCIGARRCSGHTGTLVRKRGANVTRAQWSVSDEICQWD